MQGYEERREIARTETEALEAALAAHVAQPPSPPGSPWMPTRDYILAEIEAPVSDMVHSHVQPLIETLRADIQKLLGIQNQQLYENLWPKLSLTSQVVETLSRRIEPVNRQNVVPGP
jgi:hypothetical protein